MKIILNHKSCLTKDEFLLFLEEYKKIDTNKHEVVLCPSSCYFPYCEGLLLGSQDISQFEKGAYTGEIGGELLKNFSVSYVLIRHGERVLKMNETLDISKEKLKRAFEIGLVPILCVGETEEEHKKDYLSLFEKTLDQLLEGRKEKDYIIAYEPYYATGTSKNPGREEIEKVVSFLKEKYQRPVLYGGNVSLDNIKELKEIDQIDGFLLGRLSLNPTKLKKFFEEL